MKHTCFRIVFLCFRKDFTHLRLRKRVFPSAEIWRKHAKKWYDSAETAATETPVNVMYPLTETCDCGHVSATVSHVYVMFQFTDSWSFVLSELPNLGHWWRRWFRTLMFASATWKNLSVCLAWDNCSPANLKGWNVRPFRSDRSVLCWSSLLQDEEGWYCQRVHCIIYLYQHPQYTWSCCWTSLVCWISKSAKGVYCQVRMPSDPCKWQWENVRGYREMVVYPEEGSQSCKLRWSSEYNGEV